MTAVTTISWIAWGAPSLEEQYPRRKANRRSNERGRKHLAACAQGRPESERDALGGDPGRRYDVQPPGARIESCDSDDAPVQAASKGCERQERRQEGEPEHRRGLSAGLQHAPIERYQSVRHGADAEKLQRHDRLVPLVSEHDVYEIWRDDDERE